MGNAALQYRRSLAPYGAHNYTGLLARQGRIQAATLPAGGQLPCSCLRRPLQAGLRHCQNSSRDGMDFDLRSKSPALSAVKPGLPAKHRPGGVGLFAAEQTDASWPARLCTCREGSRLTERVGRFRAGAPAGHRVLPGCRSNTGSACTLQTVWRHAGRSQHATGRGSVTAARHLHAGVDRIKRVKQGGTCKFALVSKWCTSVRSRHP
jgi:hypothetical protein